MQCIVSSATEKLAKNKIIRMCAPGKKMGELKLMPFLRFSSACSWINKINRLPQMCRSLALPDSHFMASGVQVRKLEVCAQGA